MIRSGDEARDNEAGKTTDDQKKKMCWNGPGEIRKRKHVSGCDISSRGDSLGLLLRKLSIGCMKKKLHV